MLVVACNKGARLPAMHSNSEGLTKLHVDQSHDWTALEALRTIDDVHEELTLPGQIDTLSCSMEPVLGRGCNRLPCLVMTLHGVRKGHLRGQKAMQLPLQPPCLLCQPSHLPQQPDLGYKISRYIR